LSERNKKDKTIGGKSLYSLILKLLPGRNNRKTVLSVIVSFLLLSLMSGFWIDYKSPAPLKHSSKHKEDEKPNLEPIANKPTKFSFCAPMSLVSASDGDTLKIKNPSNEKPQRIRLLGIDAPELGQKPFGERAKRYLLSLLKSSDQGKLCCQTGREALDKYGRTLAYCWAGDHFINALLLQNGHAVSLFIGNKNNDYKDLFLALEEEAAERGVGIHNPENPLTEQPSDWRKRKRYAHKADSPRSSDGV